MIDSYSFGRMKIKGKTYTADLIICPDRIIPNWWRKSGHQLSLEDIEEILEVQPETIVVGTGAMGVLKIQEEVVLFLKNQGINLIVENTKKAVQVYNELAQKGKVVGAFHLTC